MSEAKTIRCTRCYEEFTEAEVGNRTCCPACGSASVPMAIKQDVLVPINWHELRIICMWAANWAEERCEDESRVTLHRIIRRLEKHRPEGASALTLVGEIKELQDEFPTASLYGPDGDLLVPPKEDQDGPEAGGGGG